MSNRTYDTIKNIVQMIIPAVMTFVLAIITIWNLPYGEQVGLTFGATETLLGAMLKYLSIKYHKNLKKEK